MGGLVRMFTAPFTTAFALALGMWNKTGDWGWPPTLRIASFVAMGAIVLDIFVFGWTGSFWPF